LEYKPEILFSPEDRIINLIMDECLAAGSTIDIVVFLIGSKTFSKALVKAHKKGVVIRIILDSTVARTRYSTDEFLVKNGIEVKTIKVKGGSMHSKFVLIDGAKLIAGSANLTNDANYRNHEFAFISEDPDLVQPFISKFEELWRIGLPC
jgi:cardiolipin hydrolase